MRRDALIKMVRANLGKLLDAEAAKRPEGFRHQDWAAKAKVGKGTVGRAMRGEVAPRVDTLESLAAPFGLSAWQLLVGVLDVDDPPKLLTEEIQAELVELRAMRVQVEAWAHGRQQSASDGHGHIADSQDTSGKQKGASGQ